MSDHDHDQDVARHPPFEDSEDTQLYSSTSPDRNTVEALRAIASISRAERDIRRALIAGFAASLALVVILVVLVALLFGRVTDQADKLAVTAEANRQSLSELRAFTALYATQNRLHRTEANQAKACIIWMIAEAFRVNPRFASIPLPVIEGLPCDGYVVTVTPEGLVVPPPPIPMEGTP
jgi:hypothetical protein